MDRNLVTYYICICAILAFISLTIGATCVRAERTLRLDGEKKIVHILRMNRGIEWTVTLLSTAAEVFAYTLCILAVLQEWVNVTGDWLNLRVILLSVGAPAIGVIHVFFTWFLLELGMWFTSNNIEAAYEGSNWRTVTTRASLPVMLGASYEGRKRKKAA